MQLNALMPDEPYALKSPKEVERRKNLLSSQHMLPLLEYLERLRAQKGGEFVIPDFDPCDGGIDAQVLFLLEAPGRRAVGSQFISRNNPDLSAKTMCTLLAQAGLARKVSLLWNIVPWYLGTDSKIRAATRLDLSGALPFVNELIQLLAELKGIVLVGQKAQRSKKHLETLTAVKLFATHHASPRVMNRWPERRGEMLETFRSIAAFLKG